MRVRLASIGCRLNTGEVNHLARRLVGAGHSIAAPGEAADLCILNSCTVTSTAAGKSRKLLRQLRKRHPQATLVVTGCYSQLEREAVSTAGADLIVGNEDKDRLFEVLVDRGLLTPYETPADVDPPSGLHTRAFLKVQDGCDNSCTFCIVTVARGASRSRRPGEVVSDVNALVDDGFQEVVLSGVHLGSYGHERGDRRGLVHLVRRILDETTVKRLRLSSLEPWDIDAELFGLYDDQRLQPHLHIPLQSGSDRILQRMARRTTTTEYAALVKAARHRIPDLSVSTDIMVGFPGESDEQFETSLRFVERMAFARLHVFRYSRREGTRAAAFPDQIPGPVSAERSRRMLDLGVGMEHDFNRRFFGRSMDVLWEAGEPHGPGLLWSGLTPNYIRVTAETQAGADLTNQITPTRILAATTGGVTGEIIEGPFGRSSGVTLLNLPARS